MDKILKACGKSLNDYPVMSRSYYSVDEDRLINEELRYNKKNLTHEHQEFLRQLTFEQKAVYDTIMYRANKHKGGFFFLYGHGGTGKIFI